MGADPETITEAELAEALGRRHPDKPREGAEFLARVLFADIEASRTAEANAAPLAAESPRPPSPEPDTAAMSPGEGDWRERAGAAERKLDGIETHCRKHADWVNLHCPDLNRPAEALVKAADILAIIGSEETRVTESWEQCRG
jgi:hypothetical protein